MSAAPLSHRGAFLKGWQASARTTTYDLDAAEARFRARHGVATEDAFTAGWTAHATGQHSTPADGYAATFPPADEAPAVPVVEAPAPVAPRAAVPATTRTRNQTRALSALRSVAPSDVAAWQTLAETDPSRSLSLRAAVAAAVAAAPVRGVDSHAVASVAAIVVARLALSDLTNDDNHAVRMAVRIGRQTAVAAASAETALSLDEALDGAPDETVLNLRTWVGGMTPEALVIGAPDGLASRMADALSALPDETRDRFGAIAAAWLSHGAGCEACEAPGKRPGRITLGSIRTHVRGLGKSAEGQRLSRGDRAAVDAATEALAPLMASVPMADQTGAAWDLCRAVRDAGATRTGARMVNGTADGRTARTEYAAPMGAPVAVTWETARAGRTVGAIPMARREAIAARRMAAWEARETARLASVRARQDSDARQATGAVVPVAAGDSLPDPWGRTVAVPAARVVRTSAPGLPMWTGGPVAPAAAMPSDETPDRGVYVGESITRTESRTMARVSSGPVARVTVQTLPRLSSAPVLGEVTVTTRDGATVVRPMSEAEQGATDRVAETRAVEYVAPDGTVTVEEVPVVVGAWEGEDMRSGSTAPAGYRDRRVIGQQGADWRDDEVTQVKAFPTVVSPRKRAAGSTGPTVPVRLS